MSSAASNTARYSMSRSQQANARTEWSAVINEPGI
jgi:hypothetical protein